MARPALPPLARQHVLATALCVGIGSANVVRLPLALALAAAATVLLAAPRPLALACALVLLGWWWGSARLDRLDRSALRPSIGRAERARVVVTAPPRRGRFDLRVAVRVTRFGRTPVDEQAQLELPLVRSPPLGAVLDVRAEVKQPRGLSHGFDERTWLRRHGIHVVLAGDDWRIVGHRGGVAGFGDALRRRLASAVDSGLGGERRGVVLGVVLGDETGLSRGLRDRFRASGLYHLLREF